MRTVIPLMMAGLVLLLIPIRADESVKNDFFLRNPFHCISSKERENNSYMHCGDEKHRPTFTYIGTTDEDTFHNRKNKTLGDLTGNKKDEMRIKQTGGRTTSWLKRDVGKNEEGKRIYQFEPLGYPAIDFEGAPKFSTKFRHGQQHGWYHHQTPLVRFTKHDEKRFILIYDQPDKKKQIHVFIQKEKKKSYIPD